MFGNLFFCVFKFFVVELIVSSQFERFCRGGRFQVLSAPLLTLGYNISMSLIEKLLSEKGKPIVVHAGYIYTQGRTTTTKLISLSLIFSSYIREKHATN